MVYLILGIFAQNFTQKRDSFCFFEQSEVIVASFESNMDKLDQSNLLIEPHKFAKSIVSIKRKRMILRFHFCLIDNNINFTTQSTNFVITSLKIFCLDLKRYYQSLIT